MNGRFEAYVPLHRLWLGYISELLGLGPQPAGAVAEQDVATPHVATMHAKLVKADFHGSIITGKRRLMGFRSGGLINDGDSTAKHESVSRRTVGHRHLRI